MGQIVRLPVDRKRWSDWARTLGAWCPHAETAGAAWLDGAPTDRVALEQHAQACPPCRVEVLLAAGFADPAALGRGVADLEVERIRRRLGQPRRRSGQRLVWLSAAAVAALVLATVPSWGPPELGAPPPEQVWRSTGVEWHWAAPGVIEWEAVAEAHHYRILMQDAAGMTLGIETVDRTRFAIDGSATAVQIDALDSAGRLLARGQATVTSGQR